jgi:hypothetical protein
MDITESSLLEIWELFSDFVPSGKRNDVATKFLRIFANQDVEMSSLDDIRGEDEYIDYALDEIENEEDDEYDEPEYEEE